MEQTTIEIINMLSINTLLKLKKQCEAYTTYTVDFKQINYKNSIKTRQKVFAEILEQVNATLVFKQCETEKLEAKNPVEQVKSTMQENETIQQLPHESEVNNNNAKTKKTKKGGESIC